MQRYPGHVPLNLFQRAFLFASSGIAAFANPRRADLIATFGEMTMQPFFADRLRKQMLSDRVGRQILRERPRITSTSLDITTLRALPANSLGRVYTEWLDAEHVSPDTRLDVRFIDDPECAYVAQRYRECHDFYHAIAGLPVFMEGEVAVKAFEFANLGIPMTGLAALSEPFKLGSKAQRRLKQIYLPWAIQNGLRAKCLLNVYWEKELERDVDELREELGIELPPNMRSLRKTVRSELLEAATRGKEFSYSPYSNFRVGAGILLEDGSITAGGNVENASYPAGICAERSAILAAKMNGHDLKIKAVAVTSDSSMLVSPCGICRQFVREFADLDAPIYMLTGGDKPELTIKTLEELLPLSFGPDNLR